MHPAGQLCLVFKLIHQVFFKSGTHPFVLPPKEGLFQSRQGLFGFQDGICFLFNTLVLFSFLIDAKTTEPRTPKTEVDPKTSWVRTPCITTRGPLL